MALGPVHTTPVGGDGSQFFSDRGMRSDGYRVYPSDDGRRAWENWPRPFGLLRKSGHTSFSPSSVAPPQPSGSASSTPHERRPVRGDPGLAGFSLAAPPAW